ncbi:tRNA ligase 1 [Sesamum angolense]|uniref:tRNA ligase 1 n=1 Tax=Sesamum angolense TaxID=2727404 RepID=A0AAE2C529_9LAMI|nr:tRNA ligase 1 [Sesamum angolense]
MKRSGFVPSSISYNSLVNSLALEGEKRIGDALRLLEEFQEKNLVDQHMYLVSYPGHIAAGIFITNGKTWKFARMCMPIDKQCQDLNFVNINRIQNECVRYTLEEGINLYKLHTRRHGRMESTKGTYAQEWTKWEQQSRDTLFGNSEYLNPIQGFEQLRAIANGDYTAPSTGKQRVGAIIFAAVSLPLSEIPKSPCRGKYYGLQRVLQPKKQIRCPIYWQKEMLLV